MAEAEFLFGYANIAKQEFDWRTDAVKALLFDSTSSIMSETDKGALAGGIQGFTTLGECTACPNYARLTLSTPRNITERQAPLLEVGFENPTSLTFPTLGAHPSGLDPVGILIYIVKGGDIDTSNIALVAIDQGEFLTNTPDGTDYVVVAPGAGWFLFKERV